MSATKNINIEKINGLAKTNLSGTTAPTTTDDSSLGYGPGSFWIDGVLDKVYFCTDATLSAATWVDVSSTGTTDTNEYTTGTTLVGTTLYFDRTDSLSAYTADLSSLEDVKLTGVTWDNNSTLTHTLNDGTIINTTINTFSGLTVNGSISATTISGGTFYGDGSNLTGIDSTNIYTDDGTIGSGRIATLTDTLTFKKQPNINALFIEQEVHSASDPSSLIHMESQMDNSNHQYKFITGQERGTGQNYFELTSKGDVNNSSNLGLGFYYSNAKTQGVNYSYAGIQTTNKAFQIYVENGTRNIFNFYSGTNNITGRGYLQFRNYNDSADRIFLTRTGKNFINPDNVWESDAGLVVMGENYIGSEKISLQGLTLVSDYLIQDANTSPIADGTLVNDSFSFHIDGGALAGRYKDNLGVVTDLTIGAYTEYDFALRSGGVTTYYTDFYTCYNDAVSGDIIDVQTDHTTDCGLGTSQWSWDKDITINLNGHNLIVTGLGYIGVQANVKIKMTNGTFEVQRDPTWNNFAALNFVGATGTSYFEGDGAVNVFCFIGGSTRGSFQQNGAGTARVSGAIMRGNYTYCVRQSSTGKMYVDNCIMYTDEATNTDAVHGDNITVSNSTIYGQAFKTSGNYTFSGAGGRSKVRMFKNCSIIPLGTETPIGSRCAIFENCNIEATDNEVRQGIGGEQEYYNCKLERKGTAGFCFDITNTSNARLYNTQIISTGGGVKTNLPVELYHCYIKTESGYGIDLTTSVFDLNVIIDNCYIDTTGGDCIYTNSINDGLNATITNTTLISRTNNEFCLNAPTGTYFKFSKNIFKNTVDSNDVYSRVGLVTENTQVQTTDSFGNIILD